MSNITYKSYGSRVRETRPVLVRTAPLSDEEILARYEKELAERKLERARLARQLESLDRAIEMTLEKIAGHHEHVAYKAARQKAIEEAEARAQSA